MRYDIKRKAVQEPENVASVVARSFRVIFKNFAVQEQNFVRSPSTAIFNTRPTLSLFKLVSRLLDFFICVTYSLSLMSRAVFEFSIIPCFSC